METQIKITHDNRKFIVSRHSENSQPRYAPTSTELYTDENPVSALLAAVHHSHGTTRAIHISTHASRKARELGAMIAPTVTV